uniref:Uncharacterized protein n=1 Tax=Arundo donax TaxID=35708 RepID=A0A0A9FQU8_ARUDO
MVVYLMMVFDVGLVDTFGAALWYCDMVMLWLVVITLFDSQLGLVHGATPQEVPYHQRG